MLSCQRDPYCWQGTANVLSCVQNGCNWDVVLSETWLFPEGGGQPSDHGSIAGVEVISLSKNSDGSVKHTLSSAVEGTVDVTVNGVRRFDHMQQHTGQHLLSAIAHEQFGWATTAFHLGPEVCDIEVDSKDLAPSDLAALETAVNRAIREGHAVTQQLLQSASELETSGDIRTRGLPAGMEGPIRLIEIAGIDMNPCCGTHLTCTSQIQAISILRTERARAGMTRLVFVCGQRVLDLLASSLAISRDLTKLLTVPPDGQVAAVGRQLDDLRDAKKKVAVLRSELAPLLVRSLCDAAEIRRKETGGTVSCVFACRPDADPLFLQTIAAGVCGALPGAVVLLAGDVDSTGKSGIFCLAGPADTIKNLGPKVAAYLDGKGGGPKGRYQGKGARIDLASLDYLEKALSEL